MYLIFELIFKLWILCFKEFYRDSRGGDSMGFGFCGIMFIEIGFRLMIIINILIWYFV